LSCPGSGPQTHDPSSPRVRLSRPGPAATDIGAEFRIKVSSEAGSRFDQDMTGFRAEEEFTFNAPPYVATGKFVKILGL